MNLVMCCCQACRYGVITVLQRYVSLQKIVPQEQWNGFRKRSEGV